MIKNLLQFAKTIRLTCADCVYFKTQRCPSRDIVVYSDNANACSDGLLIQTFENDVLIRQTENSIITPLRFLSSTKTKNELFNTFDLTDQEITDLIISIKTRTIQKEETVKEKPIKQDPEPSPELQEKATTLLKEPSIIAKFLEHQNRYLIMDETVRKLILLTCCSAYSDYPLNLSLQQQFSSGKSTTTVQTAKYFRNVWFLGGLSPKSLIHEKGTYDEEKEGFVIDLQGKIILFLDEPCYETLMMLKPLLSHDTFETSFKFVDKESGQTITAILRGWPAVIFCAPKSKYIMELCSRWLTASPEVSTEKIQKVIASKGEKASQPNQPDPEFEIWQVVFKLISKEAPLKVIVPYAKELSECFRAKKPIDMRFFDLFLALIKATTILHAFQREKTENGNLKSTIQDYDESYKVFHEIEKSTTLGLGQNVLDFYTNIIKPLWEEEMRGNKNLLTYEMLMWRYEETTEEPISRTTIRESFLKPLEMKGLIDFEDDPKDKRRKTIAVKGTIQEASLINNEEFKKRIAETAGGISIVS